MDVLVENTGVAHKDKQIPITNAENEHAVPEETSSAEPVFLEGESDGNVALEQDEPVIEKAADEIKAGYRYAFARKLKPST